MSNKTRTGGGAGTNQYRIRGHASRGASSFSPVLSMDVGLLDPPAHRLPSSLSGACVSENTLLNSDLAHKFIDCLATSDEVLGRIRAQEYAELCGGDDYAANYGPEAERISELVSQLIEDLDKIAPEQCYFGAHEADPASYGFWPIED